MKIKIKSDDDLLLEKTLTMSNEVISLLLIKNYDHDYYKGFLGKCPHKLTK